MTDQPASTIEKVARAICKAEAGEGQILHSCPSDFQCNDCPYLDTAQAAITAYREALGQEGWRPIETSPKDGRQVLLSCPAGIFVAPSVEAAPPTVQERAKIYKADGSWPDVRFISTHWMPLPEPPLSASPKEPQT